MTKSVCQCLIQNLTVKSFKKTIRAVEHFERGGLKYMAEEM